MKKIISFALLICMLTTLTPVFASETEADTSELITYDAPDNWDDYVIDSDPMQITDEEFFGVWDKDLEKWTSKPYFRYDDFADMLPVKEAAMEGDYDLAKDELLKYYKGVAPERSIPQATHPGKVKRMTSLALEKNAYYVNTMNGSIINFFNVDNDLSEHRIDVLAAFSQKTVIGIEQIRGFVINSIDKFNTEAEIYARESQYAPRLELIVNGMPVVYTATKDAMVQGGIYGETNYGSDEIMYVRESGTYLNFNENTKRAYLAFDISNLKNTDIVSGATLILTGRNASGTGEKELGVYCLFDMSFDETKIKFNDYSDCMLWSDNDKTTWDYITSNYAAVKGKACFYHRGDELGMVASMYSYTHEPRYAYTFIRQQMGMVHNVGFNNGVFNALDTSRQVANGTKSLFWVMDSEYLTGEYLTAMMKTWWLQTDYLVNVYYGTATNNWGSYATQAVYSFLARFPEVEVFDEWYNITLGENDRMTQHFVQEDGLAVELAQGYLNTIINSLEEPMRVQQYTGLEVPYSDLMYDTIYDLLECYVYCSGPGFRGTNIGDSNDYTATAHSRIIYWYNNVFRDNKMFEYVATYGVSGKMPDNPTTNYPVTARTFMRDSWDDDARWMAFVATGSGSHGHKDMLSVSMFYKSRYLLIDPAYGSTLTDDSHTIMGGAPMHNLVTVNGRNYDDITNAKTEKFESNKYYDFIEYSGSYYTGYDQHRSVLFLKNQGFWIITDYLNPQDKTTVNSYEQNWQMLPEAGIYVDEDDLEVRSDFGDINVLVAPVGIDDMTYYMEDTKFAPIAGSFSDNKKAVLQKVQNGVVTYNTLVFPLDVNEDYKIESEVIDTSVEGANAFAAKVTNTLTDTTSVYYYYHTNDINLKQTVNVGHFKTDASTILIETDEAGKIVSTYIADATFLEDTTRKEDKLLFKSNSEVGAIAYEKKGQVLNIYSTTLDAETIKDATLYTDAVSSVKLNGDKLDVKNSGKYVYFGDSAIVEGEVEEDAPAGGNTSTDKPKILSFSK
ncbi:MAG: DNRLRE domain-containing protein [Clostridia bacterium]|nr:DNRLRE domain-containing protein [Clostridia bacterium]